MSASRSAGANSGIDEWGCYYTVIVAIHATSQPCPTDLQGISAADPTVALSEICTPRWADTL